MQSNDPLKARILNFLYQQVRENKIPQIKKGMVEDLEAFVISELADHQARIMAERMQHQASQTVVELKDGTNE